MVDSDERVSQLEAEYKKIPISKAGNQYLDTSKLLCVRAEHTYAALTGRGFRFLPEPDTARHATSKCIQNFHLSKKKTSHLEQQLFVAECNHELLYVCTCIHFSLIERSQLVEHVDWHLGLAPNPSINFQGSLIINDFIINDLLIILHTASELPELILELQMLNSWSVCIRLSVSMEIGPPGSLPGRQKNISDARKLVNTFIKFLSYSQRE